MGRGLPKRPINIFVSGGVDAKTDPKLLTGGAVLRADECYYDKIGALTKRNALTTLTQNWTGRTDSGAINNVKELFQAPGGKPMIIANGTAATLAPYRGLFQYSDAESKWVLNERAPTPMPSVVTSLDNVDATLADQFGADSCVATNAGTPLVLSVWSDTLSPSVLWFTVGPRGGPRTAKQMVDAATGTSVISRAVASGKYACVIYADSALALRVMIQDTSNLNKPIATCRFILDGAAAVSPAGRIDAILRPGSANIIVAYKAPVGVSLLEFNPATGAVVTGPVNIAAASAQRGVALLDDQLSTGFYWLSTAGTGGVVVRKLTTAFAVSTTTTVDAAAVAASANMNGYTTGANAFNVFWDIPATPSENTLIKMGTSVPVVTTWQLGCSLISRAWKYDGLYYTVVSYASTRQKTNVVLAHYSSGQAQPVGIIMPNTAGGNPVGISAGQLSAVNSYDGTTFVAGMLRQSSLTSQGGTFAAVRGIVTAFMSMAAPLRRPKELGGVLYIPGGILTAYDGVGANYAQPVIYPEAPTGAAGAGGALTASGQYQWIVVYKTVDSSGRVTRGAASQPLTLTLGAGDSSATITAASARIAAYQSPARSTDFSVITGELYRAGPASAGASQYNKVAEQQASSTTADTISFVDTMSDITAATGEPLYDAGGVLDNFCPPSCSLLETWNGRIFLVDAEYPTRIWFSKQSRPGVGVAFNPLLTLLCEGDGFGPVTAIAGMGRYLIVFKRGAILAFAGDGPNDANQGSFSNPILVSTTVGTIDPGSVVLTPDGLMFNDFRSGFWTLTLGLSLDPVGFPIASPVNPGASPGIFPGYQCADASLVPALNQVRFLCNAGGATWACWHMPLKKWTLMNSDNFSGALAVNLPAAGDAGSMWWQFKGVTGTIQYENFGLAGFTKDSGHAQSISFPPSALAGISGFELVYELQLAGQGINIGGSLEVDVDYDEEGTFAETHTIALAATTTFNLLVPLNRRKCRSIAINLFALNLNVAFSLTSLRVLCAIKGRGMYPMPLSQSFT